VLFWGRHPYLCKYAVKYLCSVCVLAFRTPGKWALTFGPARGPWNAPFAAAAAPPPFWSAAPNLEDAFLRHCCCRRVPGTQSWNTPQMPQKSLRAVLKDRSHPKVRVCSSAEFSTWLTGFTCKKVTFYSLLKGGIFFNEIYISVQVNALLSRHLRICSQEGHCMCRCEDVKYFKEMTCKEKAVK